MVTDCLHCCHSKSSQHKYKNSVDFLLASLDMRLSGDSLGSPRQYRWRRNDSSINKDRTVQQNSADVNIVVQTDHRVLRQRSNSQDMAVSPAPSIDVIEEVVPVVQTPALTPKKSKVKTNDNGLHITGSSK